MRLALRVFGDTTGNTIHDSAGGNFGASISESHSNIYTSTFGTTTSEATLDSSLAPLSGSTGRQLAFHSNTQLVAKAEILDSDLGTGSARANISVGVNSDRPFRFNVLGETPLNYSATWKRLGSSTTGFVALAFVNSEGTRVGEVFRSRRFTLGELNFTKTGTLNPGSYDVNFVCAVGMDPTLASFNLPGSCTFDFTVDP